MGRDVRDESMVGEARDRLAEFGAWLEGARQATAMAGTDRELGATQAMLECEARRAEGDLDPALWRHAADLWIELERPYIAAYARWREAEAALSAGDRTAATTALQESRAIAARLGATPLREAVEGLGRRARIVIAPAEPRADEVRAPQADQFGLTRREREVLGLVAEGRTNRQIADLLFISENTAGVHVSNILGKLGVASRVEAAAVAIRLQLVPTEPVRPAPTGLRGSR